MLEEVLSTVALRRSFGGVHAVDGVDLKVPRGQLMAIIGPNGAGKTTLFNLLTGALRCDSGRIFFKGKDVTGLPPYRLCRHGVGRTFQINSIFARATVWENVQLALLVQHRKSWNVLTPVKQFVVRETDEILEMIGLREVADKIGAELSYGDRRRLELAIALACRPELLLLDEPTSGMSLSERPAMVKLIRDIVREKGMTTLLIEHDMDVVFSVAQRITVMHRGRIIADGGPAEIRTNLEVQEVYLGEHRGAGT